MSEAIKVLIVDDERQFRATTKKILDRRGFDTIVAADGREAIEKLEEKPDVVILDISMPGMDGLEALTEIKRISPDTPVVMLTGHGGEASAREALTKGAFDYLNKPCVIDLMSAKIMEAYHHGRRPELDGERRVKDVMIPISDYTTIDADATVKEAISSLKASFLGAESTRQIMETGHRSLVVFSAGKLQGILSIVDLFKAIMPAYLSAPKPSTADTIQYSPMFWRGLFSIRTKELAGKKVKDIMSPAPLTVDGDASLMEAAYMMLDSGVRRLAVVKGKTVVGIVREQELFFEMERIMR